MTATRATDCNDRCQLIDDLTERYCPVHQRHYPRTDPTPPYDPCPQHPDSDRMHGCEYLPPFLKPCRIDHAHRVIDGHGAMLTDPDHCRDPYAYEHACRACGVPWRTHHGGYAPDCLAARP